VVTLLSSLLWGYCTLGANQGISSLHREFIARFDDIQAPILLENDTIGKEQVIRLSKGTVFSLVQVTTSGQIKDLTGIFKFS